MPGSSRVICWIPLWNTTHPAVGLEHLVLSDGLADSVVLAFDDRLGPFRLDYHLAWDESWRVREVRLALVTAGSTRSMLLRADGEGHWRQGDGRILDELDGCIDVDIWPTPFTNTFPIRRVPLAVQERRQFDMAWIDAPAMVVRRQPQAYTRLADRRYRFESLDGSGFQADLPVDGDGVVVDYTGLFRRAGDLAP